MIINSVLAASGGGASESVEVSLVDDTGIVLALYWIDETGAVRTDSDMDAETGVAVITIRPAVGTLVMLLLSRSQQPALSNCTFLYGISAGGRPTEYIRVYQVTG